MIFLTYIREKIIFFPLKYLENFLHYLHVVIRKMAITKRLNSCDNELCIYKKFATGNDQSKKKVGDKGKVYLYFIADCISICMI